MSPLALLAKFSLEKQDCTVKNLAKSVYFLIQKLLRLTIPGYLKDNSVFSCLLSERVVCVVSRFSTTWICSTTYRPRATTVAQGRTLCLVPVPKASRPTVGSPKTFISRYSWSAKKRQLTGNIIIRPRWFVSHWARKSHLERKRRGKIASARKVI